RTSPGANGDDPDVLDIELLKLHGSLNFPAPRQKKESSEIRFNTTDALPSPLILPPIFNKQSTESQRHIWSTALQRLRSAKNIVIVGYSLPRTDIYMQYFLKSALGPNGDLNRIFVFDPAMYSDGESAKEMKSRYQDCFSPQLKSRIHFKPDEVGADQPDYRTPIEDKQTRKLIFDPEAKDRMQWQLAKFGIRASVIYPGLDGVAKDVRAVCETARTGTIREVDPFRSMANWGR
ncbi:MAG TPA: hypothetical protein VJP83_03145, partial [Terriglobales bacterium]|nr:hypothetical protein [Terriglobales bacterium]